MANRNWSVEDKMGIVLRGLKYSQSIADLCREFQIRQSQYYKWRDQFLEHGRVGLAGGKQNGAEQHRQEVERSSLGYRSPQEFLADCKRQQAAA